MGELARSGEGWDGVGDIGKMHREKALEKNVWIETVWRKGQYLDRKEAQRKKSILRSSDNFSADLKMKTGLYTLKLGIM